MATVIKRSERRLGQILVDQGVLTEDQLEEAIEEHSSQGKKLGEILIGLKLANEEQITEAMATQHGLPYLRLSEYEIDPEIIESISEDVARKYRIIPVDRSDNNLTVALADPANIFLLDDIKLRTKMDIVPLISLREDIEAAIEKYYGDSDALSNMMKDFDDGDGVELMQREEEDDEEESSTEGDAPVVKLVNMIVAEGIKTRASDIHIEPDEKDIRLRYRIDGTLHEMSAPPKRMQNALASRIKIMSELDISEKRKPQDGRFKIRQGKKSVDFRVSVLPTVHGEKIVMRLLDKSNLNLDMSQLGFERESLAKFERAVKRPFGMILVTGPTGSGKSTTLYSALSTINTIDKNIVTVEDPVEYQVRGINQVQARPDIGFTFAEGLKSILRQDPDVVMIGEIRDFETGEIAVKAALTGHLVLSTLHTNDAPSTPTRMIDMGIEPFLVTASLILVIAQRLVRRICSHCKKPYKPSPELLQQLGIRPKPGKELVFYEGEGCSACADTGYRGRVALYEVMEMDDHLSHCIMQGMHSNDLKKEARKQGMLTLRDSGIRKVLAGMTTVKEVVSVTFEN
jgi:type IV pilus assembly protein PilB